jgi:hypothetical protein
VWDVEEASLVTGGMWVVDRLHRELVGCIDLSRGGVSGWGHGGSAVDEYKMFCGSSSGGF